MRHGRQSDLHQRRAEHGVLRQRRDVYRCRSQCGRDAKATEIATINWGDGTSSAGTITQATAGGPFTVAGKHTYAVAKTFTVTVAIHDVQGGAKATAVTARW